MKYKLIFLSISLAFLAAGCNRVPTLSINRHEVKVELAQTQLEQEKGLSGRDSILQNSGMLFIFDKPGQYAFWMKGMKFPLDFIWIKDAKVVEITQSVPVLPLVLYKPGEPVDWVLEVNAGWSQANQIQVGDSAILTK